MAAITAKMVKELREKSGAGMMDCKKALTKTDGDMEKAIEFLRENGQMKAQKKADRIAAEGLCLAVVSEDEKKGLFLQSRSLRSARTLRSAVSQESRKQTAS